MTKRIFLHVGTPKSGTTYLQSILRANTGRLAAAGVLVAGATHREVVHATLVIREDPRAEQLLSDRERESWQRIVGQIRAWRGESVILSYELLCAATEAQARKALADLGEVEVHVIVTARDLVRAVVSGWQERLKFRFAQPLEEVLPREQGEFGWRTLDPRGAARRWGSTLPEKNVHLVTVPRSGGDPTELWHRFATVCGIDDLALDLGATTSNASLSAAGSEVLRRVTPHLGAGFATNAQQAVWVRDTLAHRVLVPIGGGSLGITDEQFERWSTRSEQAITELAATGYDVQGDLEDLRGTRPTGQLPSAVPDEELLDTACQAIARLLGLLREQAQTARNAASGSSLPRRMLRKLVRTTTEPVAAAQLARVERQLDELRGQMRASRGLHQRVADLDDIVSGLLLPAGQGGNRAVRRAIRDYRRDAL